MSDLVRGIRHALREVADPSRAAGQQVYMKSAMPYLGASVPDVRRIVRAAAKGEPAPELLEAARMLWDDATHREERYAGMMLLGAGDAKGDLATLPHIEHMARTGQWWDYIDGLSTRLGELLLAHRDTIEPVIRAWSTDDDFWVRRLAIESQIGLKQNVDRVLLADVIVPNLADREFFIRKAIGWALRDFARTDPGWVREFARTHDLSPLSRREALKHLGS